MQGVSRIIIRPHYKELMVHFPCQQQQSFAQRCADLCRWGSKPISMLKTPHASEIPLTESCWSENDKPVFWSRSARVTRWKCTTVQQTVQPCLSVVIVLFSCIPRGNDIKTKDGTEHAVRLESMGHYMCHTVIAQTVKGSAFYFLPFIHYVSSVITKL